MKLGLLAFLRRIRRSLIESGSARKYLLYAIGEVALVVIGILFALQINNWNEDKKARTKEKKLLENLADNIESNIEIFEFRRTLFENNIYSSGVIINHINKRQPFHDTLLQHFANSNLEPTLGYYIPEVGFRSLSNAGFDMILSDSLRLGIIDLFENVYDQNMAIIEDYQNFGRPDFRQDKKRKFFPTNNQPFDYKSLIDDKEYLFDLQAQIVQRNFMMRFLNQSINKSFQVLQLVKDELGESE